jgi:biotin carboxylase
MNKTLLFVGGGLEAIPGINLAKEMGHTTVVSDLNPQAPGCLEADYILRASTYDVPSSVVEARNFSENSRSIDGVMSVASDIPLTVATIAAELKLPGISIESARLASDKLAMKEQFKKKGINTPWFSEIYSARDLEEVIHKHAGHVVIKPIDSRGARGVLRLTAEDDLKWAFSEAQKNSPSKRVMTEEFLDGPQVSTESIIFNGKMETPGFSDRNYEFLERFSPYIIENGGDLPSHLPLSDQELIKKLVYDGAIAMGITTGVVKGDIVFHNGIPFIIELAARLSGGYFCSHEIPLNTGVDFVGEAIKLALGENINMKSLLPKYSRPVAQRYIFPKPGRVTRISGVEEVVVRPSVAMCEIRTRVGDNISPAFNHPSRAGVIITHGETKAEAIAEADRAIKDIRIETNEF